MSDSSEAHRRHAGGSVARSVTRGPVHSVARLELRDVSVRFGATLALSGVSLRVEPGQIVAVIGPSGSGKSTLLRATAGLEPIEQGVVRLDGRDLTGVPPHRRGIGMMFQDHALFPHMNVERNVGYGLRIAGWSGAPRRERVQDLLDMVGLSGFAQRRVNALSGGEAQRVALARSLAPSPGLLLLDEPLGSLDRVLREQLVGDLRRVLAEGGSDGQPVSAVHVTHDQAEAFALADEVIVLRSGQIVGQGRPEELWADPGSSFIAEFLGHQNRWTIDGRAVFVPITAIRVLAEGERPRSGEWVRTAIAQRIHFQDGRYVIGGTTIGERFVVWSDEAVTLGAEVALAIQSAKMRTLNGNQVLPYDD